MYYAYSCAAFLYGAAESRDEFEGGQPPRRTGKQDIPCFDPATGTYLGTLPAMAPDEVTLTSTISLRKHQAWFASPDIILLPLYWQVRRKISAARVASVVRISPLLCNRLLCCNNSCTPMG